jgi:putative addiction module killer protein
VIELREGLDAEGRSSYRRWFAGLDGVAAAKVEASIYRLGQGNISHVRSVGGGVSELKIDFGPGYRVYFGRRGEAVIVLLGGGSKKRQQRDIEAARALWHELRRANPDRRERDTPWH